MSTDLKILKLNTPIGIFINDVLKKILLTRCLRIMVNYNFFSDRV